MPRTHCLMTPQGAIDWPWVIAILALSAGVIGAYLRIFAFWMRSYYAEQRRDRNQKLFELAAIFLFCAICGYAMSMLMFAWPAYRLLAFFLVILNIFSWKFTSNLKPFQKAFAANRLERQLRESLESRAQELERLVQQRTREAEEARALADGANHAKSDFLAHMSHEIRTPLTALLGYADLLEEEAAHSPSPSSAGTEMVTTIRRAGEHLLTVVNDILDLSKIEAGKLQVDECATDLAQVFASVETLIRPRAESKSLSLDVRLTPDNPGVFLTDPTRLRQILLNLAGNAVKFTDRGRVEVVGTFEPGTSTLRVEVRDTGTGLSNEQIGRLFKPFEQADATVTRKHGGTGLGLTISRQLAQMMGGTLEIAMSTPGQGSVFVVTLPLRSAPKSAAPLARPVVPAVPTAGKALSGRILFAEDGPDNQRLVAVFLRKAGAEVEIAANGRIALEMLTRAGGPTFDLLLTDMQMPEMDGYTLARTLRAKGFTLPIIALTAHAMAGDRARCLEAGCDDYTTKPLDRQRLVAVCATWLAAMRSRDVGSAA